MRRRVPRLVSLLAVAVAVVLAACGSASAAPGWTFGPAASGAAAASSPAAASASPAAASELPAGSPSAAPSSAPEASGSPAPSPGASAGPTPSPAPPDPGEPGFVAGTKLKPRVIDIAMTDLLLYNPTAVSVAQGETITFRVTNTGKAEHEFKVGPMDDVFNDLESAPEISAIAAGETRELTYTFTGTGPYAYACHEPGHYENGMYGFVNVVPTTPYLGTKSHPRMVVIRMDDHLEFVPPEVSVTPGETILFVLSNIGTEVTHEFQIGPADRVALDQVDGQIVLEADQIEPQHVAYLTYTFGSVGPYAFACHEPGHYEAGMKGIIDLTP